MKILEKSQEGRERVLLLVSSLILGWKRLGQALLKYQ
jgi:hypothetical protein